MFQSQFLYVSHYQSIYTYMKIQCTWIEYTCLCKNNWLTRHDSPTQGLNRSPILAAFHNSPRNLFNHQITWFKTLSKRRIYFFRYFDTNVVRWMHIVYEWEVTCRIVVLSYPVLLSTSCGAFALTKVHVQMNSSSTVRNALKSNSADYSLAFQ